MWLRWNEKSSSFHSEYITFEGVIWREFSLRRTCGSDDGTPPSYFTFIPPTIGYTGYPSSPLDWWRRHVFTKLYDSQQSSISISCGIGKNVILKIWFFCKYKSWTGFSVFVWICFIYSNDYSKGSFLLGYFETIHDYSYWILIRPFLCRATLGNSFIDNNFVSEPRVDQGLFKNFAISLRFWNTYKAHLVEKCTMLLWHMTTNFFITFFLKHSDFCFMLILDKMRQESRTRRY